MTYTFAIVLCAVLAGCSEDSISSIRQEPEPEPQPIPSTARVIFQSDWRTVQGNSETAISDGGKWNWMSANAGDNGSIVDAPATFPTHKVLRVRSNGVRDGWLAPTVNTLGQIPVGTTRNFRWYHAFHEPALADAGQHPIQDGGAISQSNWYMSTTNGGNNLRAGEWGLDYFIQGNAWEYARFVLGTRDGQFTPLQKGRVYRFEIQMMRTSTARFRFHAWVYDAAGNLLYDDDDFRSRDGSTSIGSYEHTFQNVANTSIFLVGLNGIGNSPPWPIHSSDQAGIAIVQGLPERQPIGAYGSVEGEVRR